MMNPGPELDAIIAEKVMGWVMGPTPQDWIDHVYDLIEKRGNHFIWTGRLSSGSPVYTIVGQGNRSVRKLLYIEKYNNWRGTVSPLCGEPLCVKPSHNRCKRGGKLSAADYENIQKEWALSVKYKTTYALLGKKYGISRAMVGYIVSGKYKKGIGFVCARLRASQATRTKDAEDGR